MPGCTIYLSNHYIHSNPPIPLQSTYIHSNPTIPLQSTYIHSNPLQSLSPLQSNYTTPILISIPIHFLSLKGCGDHGPTLVRKTSHYWSYFHILLFCRTTVCGGEVITIIECTFASPFSCASTTQVYTCPLFN